MQKSKLPNYPGVAEIIVASMLLCEIDLKGLSSDSSNIGIVTQEELGSIFFKIDHDQSFYCSVNAYADRFDLESLRDMESSLFLQKLSFIPSADMIDIFRKHQPEKLKTANRLNEKHFDELKRVVRGYAKMDRKKFETVLDFCEEQVAQLATYPFEKDLRKGGALKRNYSLLKEYY